MVLALSFCYLFNQAQARENTKIRIGSQIWLLIVFLVLMALGGASTSSGRRGRGGAGEEVMEETGDGKELWEEVYYNYECTDEERDRYVKAYIQNNWKQLLSKEKSRADERVKLAIGRGYTHATRLMVKSYYFNEGAWESITKH
ncbi:hypothetical protein AgCh_016290 [Apium graveolens]